MPAPPGAPCSATRGRNVGRQARRPAQAGRGPAALFPEQHGDRGRQHHAGRQGHRPQAGGGRAGRRRAVHLDLRLRHRYRCAAPAAPAHPRQPVRPDWRGAPVR
ncbi:hypothetical protein G6F31_020616 [Rhizopus arrhizus]|nr:hypothetical protein G6F31_020616 [Rhizopus arrhizus]